MGLRWVTGVYSSPRGPGLPQGQAGPSPSPSVRWPWSPTHDRATLAWVGVQTVCGMPVVQQGPRAEPGRRRGGVRCPVRSSRIFRLLAGGLSLRWDPRPLPGRSERRAPHAPGGPWAPPAVRSGEDALGGRFSKHHPSGNRERFAFFLANLQHSAR